MAVSVLLTAHVTIVLHIAFSEVFSNVLVALDVSWSQVSMFVSIDCVEIAMCRLFRLCIVLAVVSRVGGRTSEEQCSTSQGSELG